MSLENVLLDISKHFCRVLRHLLSATVSLFGWDAFSVRLKPLPANRLSFSCHMINQNDTGDYQDHWSAHIAAWWNCLQCTYPLDWQKLIPTSLLALIVSLRLPVGKARVFLFGGILKDYAFKRPAQYVTNRPVNIQSSDENC